jgi:hypothetical protein
MWEDLNAQIDAAEARADVLLSMIELIPIAGTIITAAWNIMYGAVVDSNRTQAQAEADSIFWLKVRCCLYCIFIDQNTNLVTQDTVDDWQDCIYAIDGHPLARSLIGAMVPALSASLWNGLSAIGALEPNNICEGECPDCGYPVEFGIYPWATDGGQETVTNMGNGWYRFTAGYDSGNSQWVCGLKSDTHNLEVLDAYDENWTPHEGYLTRVYLCGPTSRANESPNWTASAFLIGKCIQGIAADPGDAAWEYGWFSGADSQFTVYVQLQVPA